MPDPKEVIILDPHAVPVTFVSDVAGIGFLNGVVNLTLVTARFTPVGKDVDADLVVASRLRFDLFCAQRVHEMLGNILEQNTKGPAQPAPSANEVN